jgi:hypothetical protein
VVRSEPIAALKDNRLLLSWAAAGSRICGRDQAG